MLCGFLLYFVFLLKKKEMPVTRAIESRFRKQGLVVAGVDEAGRGPLAGPVVAAAVVLPEAFDLGKDMTYVRDSKKLSEKRRELMYRKLTPLVRFNVAVIPAETIDRINIRQATLAAHREALIGLPGVDVALIDGDDDCKLDGVQRELVVGGDASELVIAAASIIAKVTRDRIMHQAEVDFPGWGFGKHKGYGCKSHMALIQAGALPVTPLHRRSFNPLKRKIT